MSTEAFRLEPNIPEEPRQQAQTELVPIADAIPLTSEAIVIAGHMNRIEKKLGAEMQHLENTSNLLAQSLDGVIPKDQCSYTVLCERLEDTKKFLGGLDEFVEPWKKLFYRPYKAVLERGTEIGRAAREAVERGKSRRLQFERDAQAAAEAETLRLKKEQEAREAEQRLTQAVKAEELGLSEQAVETILTAPSVAPTPVVAPAIQRPQGVRKIAANWQAKFADPAAFWKWARQQKEMPAMLAIDFPAMNREAKTHQVNLGQKYPGWLGVNKGGA